ncbi:IS66 family insertion sequence element accessory protein TnpA [Halodesulfovibrio aestuarii]|uniref:IS66 family insertion sequence element accessory protein TnpB n=1 Tax=Halodesulfovibrio aestuarii TaxID=126333 RepID=A0A8G2C9Z3_9BACT|nr:hypothetical protein [Halodesulfovibrio aestuarii]SHJ05536.1 hypothetical protein SAMN05660830_01501 [Halodesulfovibrio aestuarii]
MTRKQRCWKKHIADWQNSGLSQAAYCRGHDISSKAFGYYKRKLASASELQEIVAVPNIAMPPASLNAGGIAIKLYVCDNLMLNIEPGFCQQTLRRILDVIGA